MIFREIVFLSIVVFAIGVVWWRRGQRILAEQNRAKATIIENIKKKDSEGSNLYYPVIQFLTSKNELITKELSMGFQPAMRVGKNMTVVYDPDNPEDIVVWPVLQLEIIPGLLSAIGFTGLIAALLDFLEIVPLIPD
jgi:hypothetical protein